MQKEVTKELLEALYKEHKSVAGVANALGMTQIETVRKWLHKNGVQLKKRGGVRKFDPDKETLEKQYQEMSMSQIASLYGVGETTVHTKIHEFGIKFKNEDMNGRKRKRPPISDTHRLNMSKARMGKYRGENSPTWKGGKAIEHLRLRQSALYREWRKAALALRGSACQDCGAVDGSVCECCGTKIKLHVHHVLSFAKYPETRFDPTNSEVLCPKCHYSRHNRKSEELLETP